MSVVTEGNVADDVASCIQAPLISPMIEAVGAKQELVSLTSSDYSVALGAWQRPLLNALMHEVVAQVYCNACALIVSRDEEVSDHVSSVEPVETEASSASLQRIARNVGRHEARAALYGIDADSTLGAKARPSPKPLSARRMRIAPPASAIQSDTGSTSSRSRGKTHCTAEPVEQLPPGRSNVRGVRCSLVSSCDQRTHASREDDDLNAELIHDREQLRKKCQGNMEQTRNRENQASLQRRRLGEYRWLVRAMHAERDVCQTQRYWKNRELQRRAQTERKRQALNAQPQSVLHLRYGRMYMTNDVDDHGVAGDADDSSFGKLPKITDAAPNDVCHEICQDNFVQAYMKTVCAGEAEHSASRPASSRKASLQRPNTSSSQQSKGSIDGRPGRDAWQSSKNPWHLPRQGGLPPADAMVTALLEGKPPATNQAPYGVVGLRERPILPKCAPLPALPQSLVTRI